jgi:predicted ATPase/transcriptional regulator with XRE-family HTH domain
VDSAATNAFGELLRRHRLSAGLSQEALAERARVSTSAVGALERGNRRAPYRDTVALLADALKLTPADRRVFEEVAESTRGRRSAEASTIPVNNLPVRLTSFVGRNDEVEAIKSLLGEHRLLTVTGSGGVGKTCTSLEAAKQLLHDWPHEARFVDLSALIDGKLVASEVMTALESPLSDSADPLMSLVMRLKSRSLLLILDNCEHVIADVGALAGAVLRGCPQVKILATSRERLAIEGEHVYRLPSLSIPPAESRSVDEALTYASFQLFMDRARAIDAHFELRRDDLRMTAEICRRLEGIPLALELAATRVPALGIGFLNQQLREQVTVGIGHRGMPQRQRTMLATIAWSYNLLSEPERRLLQRLAVFRGGIPFEAVEAIGGDSDVIASLVGKSLLTSTSRDDTVRISMLESVRAFAMQELTASGEFDAAARAQATWFAAFAERNRDRWETDHGQWMREVGAEIDNARTALDWILSSARPEDLKLAVQFLPDISHFFRRAIRVGELRRWVTAVLQRIDAARQPDLAMALVPLQIYILEGREKIALAEQSLPMLERFLERDKLIFTEMAIAYEYAKRLMEKEADQMIARAFALIDNASAADTQMLVNLLQVRCGIHVFAGRTAEARLDLAEAKRRAELSVAGSEGGSLRLHWEALIEFRDGNMERAAGLLRTVVEIQRAQFTTPLHALSALVCTYLALGNVDAAVTTVEELFEAVKFEPDDVCGAILLFAPIAAMRGAPEIAARLSGFAMADHARQGATLNFMGAPAHKLLTTSLSAQLPSDRIEMLEAGGALLSVDRALEEALEALASIAASNTALQSPTARKNA